MEISRITHEPVAPPPDTIDITGLTLREAGVLKNLILYGIEWDEQEDWVEGFLRRLHGHLVRTGVDDASLCFAKLHGLDN